MDDKQAKKSYERPAVHVSGTIEDITLANNFASQSDGVFVQTPQGLASLGS
ncbi:MAG: hypothetical protein JWL73_3273 [Actinomycetia bacterium]|nr:hypothetical protein [Actinomycetes bacterium]